MAMSISVVVVSYRRVARLNMILKAWLHETKDVWLCDCTPNGFQTDLPVKRVWFKPDPGNRVRHAISLLTSGDIVIKADDDIVPHEGLATDFQHWMEKLGPSILGIHGRSFHGPDYYHNTKLFGGKAVSNPVKVDFVGVITASPRKFLSMDLKKCQTEVEDLYWQMARYKEAPKYVIPTTKFQNLAECKDKERLCGNAASKRVRREFYRAWWEKAYR